MALFLADECTFTSTIQLMRGLGLQVQRVQELGMIGAGDPEVFRKAQQLQAVLVTNDQGFGDVRVYPPSSHQGVI
jgi:predicted nuclease of predicted toxin-antitoxin system